MKSVTRRSLVATAGFALACGAACAPPPPATPPAVEPQPLVSIHGSVSSALQATPTELNAYLYWATASWDQGIVIDEVPVEGQLPAAFNLSILEAPADSDYVVATDGGQVPHFAEAIVLVTTPDMEAVIRGEAAPTPGGVWGASETFILYTPTDDDAAQIASITGFAIQKGFNLIGPNAEGVACQDANNATLQTCIDAHPECNADDAPDGCLDPCFGAAVPECPRDTELKSLDEPLSVVLQTIE